MKSEISPLLRPHVLQPQPTMLLPMSYSCCNYPLTASANCEEQTAPTAQATQVRACHNTSELVRRYSCHHRGLWVFSSRTPHRHWHLFAWARSRCACEPVPCCRLFHQQCLDGKGVHSILINKVRLTREINQLHKYATRPTQQRPSTTGATNCKGIQ
jgi:hypothetical protein